MVTGGAFCLLSVFCGLMMLYFDKRAEHILHKDEAASGSLHYMLFYPHLEYLCAIGQNKVVFHCCDSICTLTWLYLTLFAYNCIRMLLVGQRRSYASICLSVRLSVGYFLPAVSGGGCSPDNWSQCCSCISFHKILWVFNFLACTKFVFVTSAKYVMF